MLIQETEFSINIILMQTRICTCTKAQWEVWKDLTLTCPNHLILPSMGKSFVFWSYIYLVNVYERPNATRVGLHAWGYLLDAKINGFKCNYLLNNCIY